MMLLTKELRTKLPRIGETFKEKDPLIICKFFTPDANWTWYAIEFDGEDMFFGYVEGLESEYGFFRLSELQEVRGALGLPIERDLYFEPCHVSAVVK